MHHRLAPRRHFFQHDIFMFYLDLDEADTVAQQVWSFGHNRGRFYNFRDDDHEPAGPGPLKQRVLDYLQTQGVAVPAGARVCLLTLPRVAGYIFNPISVYYCFTADGEPLGQLIEVGNTFREIKLYFVPASHREADGGFRLVTPKHFYVSPFSPLDLSFDFQLRLPGEELHLRVDDREGDARVLLSTLNGRRLALTNANVLRCTLAFPFVTLKVIALIHWHALRLWLKRIPFYRKADRPDLQQDVRRSHLALNAKLK
jgi:DUF1365 family protein